MRRLADDRRAEVDSLDLPAHPRVKPWYRIAHTGDAVVFEYGDAAICFGGRAARTLLPPLLPLLDGSRTVAQIESALGEPAIPAVRRALEMLAERELLADGAGENDLPEPVRETASFLAASSPTNISTAVAGGVLARASLTVAGGGETASELVRLLRLSGAAEVEVVAWERAMHGSPDLILAAPEPEELGVLDELNRALLLTGTPWFLVQPFNGRYAGIGPLYIPGETCCHECFRLRRAANSGFATEFWALEHAVRGIATPAPLAAAVGGIATSLAFRWLVDRDPALPGRFVALALDDRVPTSAHVVYRVPRCPVCSPLAAQADPLPWGAFT